MEISPTLTPSSTPGQTTSTASAVTADFQTFLQLLTSQLRNQDPLKPMESTQFVAQLATFSSVEQQVLSNQKLDTLAASLRASDTAALSGWIDRTVETRSAARFDGTPLEFSLDHTPNAGDRLVVTNAMGEVVSDQPFTSHSWDGRISGGLRAPDGDYTLSLRSSQASGDQLLEQARTAGTVVEARLQPEGVDLILASGQSVPLADVAALR
ncbi:flagellar hook capping FlgD N-terminal domain-containing protein [Pontivivens insulae]|uniref:Basal-body rod modification protein FlgD n=1 Tax=Pontivivens insulae TaxID=1639689 RepID=A0A2R8A9E0_9RHOB|nr:flagellar hook capping FlgD N-terminal domain-containing protein [Pontivivens insulae]RED12756.1 flagellar basal-body rod modification protein FlgD [Pontivivens insulae]SPF28847.1 Basal-body rod modification protein FlgD [Pontivivens insulae]